MVGAGQRISCRSLLSAHFRFARRSSMGDFMIELWGFMKERKKFWLLPIVICLVMLGSLVFFTSGSAVAPFIYTLF
jgi:hypothetical protein